MTNWILDKDFKVGDRVESRDGTFRGNITKIEESAEKWPYTVENGSGGEALFSASELRKTDLEISLVSVSEALAQLDVMIDAKQKELATLLMSRRVLEQVEDHG
jgi:hypothetical protein